MTSNPGRGLTEQYVKANGRRFRTVHAGSGEPLVVFESGLGAGVSLWAEVQRQVARHTADGVPDVSDRCPNQPGLTADGCTAQTPSRIEVSVDGVLAGAQDVYADYGPDDFAVAVELAPRSQTVRVEWLDADTVLARHELVINRDRRRRCERADDAASYEARCSLWRKASP